MAITTVATATARYTGPSTGATTAAFDSTGATFIELTVAYYPNNPPTVTDNKGNTYTAQPPSAAAPTGGQVVKKFHTAGTALVGTGHTVTVTGTNIYAAFVVRAYASSSGPLIFAGAARNSVGSVTALSTGSVTPPHSPALVTSGLALDGTVSALAATAPMTLVGNQAQVPGQCYGVAASDEVQTTATARNPGWTWTTARNVAGATAAYAVLPSPLLAVALPGQGSQFGGTSASVDTTGATLLVLSLAWNPTVGATPGTPTDSKGNTWTALTLRSANSAVRFYYVLAPTVGTGHTFTIGGTSFATAMVYAFSGGPWGTPTENGATTTVNAGTLATGSITPSTNGAIVLSAISYQDTGGGTVDSGLVQSTVFASPTDGRAASAWTVQSTAAAINPTWTYSGGTLGAAVAVVAFTPAGAAAVERSDPFVIYPV